jgi:hypothetical protein
LGLEPKGEGTGQTGCKILDRTLKRQATEPVKAAEGFKDNNAIGYRNFRTSGSGAAEVRKVNSALPMARAAKVEPYLEPIKLINQMNQFIHQEGAKMMTHRSAETNEAQSWQRLRSECSRFC